MIPAAFSPPGRDATADQGRGSFKRRRRSSARPEGGSCAASAAGDQLVEPAGNGREDQRRAARRHRYRSRGLKQRDQETRTGRHQRLCVIPRDSFFFFFFSLLCILVYHSKTGRVVRTCPAHSLPFSSSLFSFHFFRRRGAARNIVASLPPRGAFFDRGRPCSTTIFFWELGRPLGPFNKSSRPRNAGPVFFPLLGRPRSVGFEFFTIAIKAPAIRTIGPRSRCRQFELAAPGERPTVFRSL